MGDTFKITAYNKNIDVCTLDFVLAARPGYAGATYTGVTMTGLPKDTIANVKVYLRAYADAFIAGKILEANKQADISNEVKTLLNVTTTF